MKQSKGNSWRVVNQVRIAFSPKAITPWGGVASLIAKFIEVIDFRGWVEHHIPIEESSNNSKGVYEKVIAQFITVLVGGFRFSHALWWGHGIEVLMRTFGFRWLPQAPTTLTRFWNKIGTQSLAERFGVGARALARAIVGWEGIDEDYVNLDSSVATRYGEQEGARRGYNPKKPGRPSHHPLIAFLGSGYVVNLWNRAGNASSGQSAKAFFKQTVELLGQGFRVKGVLCDIGFYLMGFIEYLEAHGFRYMIAVPISPILQRQILGITEWEQVSAGVEVAAFRFEHLDRKWNKERRYVVVRQLLDVRPKATGKQPSLFKELDDWKSYRMSLMITNDEHSAAEQIWREYRKRANDENKVKELKENFGLASFNMKSFWATEAVMVINAVVFHNLIHYLNRNILNPHGPIEQLRTLRSRYLIIPAQLGTTAGYPVLRLSVRDRKLRSKISYYLERISLISHRLNCITVPDG